MKATKAEQKGKATKTMGTIEAKAASLNAPVQQDRSLANREAGEGSVSGGTVIVSISAYDARV